MSDPYKSIPVGQCQCGCGQFTPIAKENNKNRGLIKGQPRNCIPGHRITSQKGALHPLWKGGRTIDRNGYVLIKMPTHNRAQANGYVYEHILVAEKALGKPLPSGAIPHHIDKNRSNNITSNLVLCQDIAYHLLLHRRERALKACGHANWRKCTLCKQYDDPSNLMTKKGKGGCSYHKGCKNSNNRKSAQIREEKANVSRSARQATTIR